jgi:hypothetical protein
VEDLSLQPLVDALTEWKQQGPDASPGALIFPATTTDGCLQELPEGGAATVNAINCEFGKKLKKAPQKRLSKNLLPNVTRSESMDNGGVRN